MRFTNTVQQTWLNLIATEVTVPFVNGQQKQHFLHDRERLHPIGLDAVTNAASRSRSNDSLRLQPHQ